MELGEQLLTDIKKSLGNLEVKVEEFTGDEKSIKKSPLKVFTTSIDDLSEAVKKLTESSAASPSEATITSLDKSVASLDRILKDYGTHVSTHKKSLDDHIKALEGATGDSDGAGGGVRRLSGATRERGLTTDIIKGTLITSIIIGAFKKLMSPIMAPIRAIKDSSLFYPALFFALFGDVLEEGFKGITDRLRQWLDPTGSSWWDELLGTGIFAVGWWSKIPGLMPIGILIGFLDQLMNIITGDYHWAIKLITAISTLVMSGFAIKTAYGILKKVFYDWPKWLIAAWPHFAAKSMKVLKAIKSFFTFGWLTKLFAAGEFFGAGGAFRTFFKFGWLTKLFKAGSFFGRGGAIAKLIMKIPGITTIITAAVGAITAFTTAIAGLVAFFMTYVNMFREQVKAEQEAEGLKEGFVTESYRLRDKKHLQRMREGGRFSDAELDEMSQLQKDTARLRALGNRRHSAGRVYEEMTWWQKFKDQGGPLGWVWPDGYNSALSDQEEEEYQDLRASEAKSRERYHELKNQQINLQTNKEAGYDLHKQLNHRNIAESILNPNTVVGIDQALITREYKDGTLEALRTMVTELQTSGKSIEVQTELLEKFLQSEGLRKPGATIIVQPPADTTDDSVSHKYTE
jgi:hypothetical protein